MAKGFDRRHRHKRGSRAWALGHFWTTVTWLMAIVLFFPVLWMVLTAFKQEGAAQTYPPTLTLSPTLSEFARAFGQGGGGPLAHPLFVAVASLILVLALGSPAAYALSIRAVKRWRD